MNESQRHSATPGPLEHHTRSIAFGIFILALGVLAGAGAREASSREQESLRQQQDKREAIALAPAHREVVLTEMRTMLAAMQGVMDGAARMDVPRVRAAAQSAGTAAMAGRDSAFQNQLPDGFRKQEAEVHAVFDAMADAIRGFTARDTALAYLSRISQQCVACHAKYRLTTKE